MILLFWSIIVWIQVLIVKVNCAMTINHHCCPQCPHHNYLTLLLLQNVVRKKMKTIQSKGANSYCELKNIWNVYHIVAPWCHFQPQMDQYSLYQIYLTLAYLLPAYHYQACSWQKWHTPTPTAFPKSLPRWPGCDVRRISHNSLHFLTTNTS